MHTPRFFTHILSHSLKSCGYYLLFRTIFHRITFSKYHRWTIYWGTFTSECFLYLSRICTTVFYRIIWNFDIYWCPFYHFYSTFLFILMTDHYTRKYKSHHISHATRVYVFFHIETRIFYLQFSSKPKSVDIETSHVERSRSLSPLCTDFLRTEMSSFIINEA